MQKHQGTCLSIRTIPCAHESPPMRSSAGTISSHLKMQATEVHYLQLGVRITGIPLSINLYSPTERVY